MRPCLVSLTLIALLTAMTTLPASETSSERIEARNVKHGIVYDEPGKFGGWPANCGGWSWGDELLVGIQIGHYSEEARRKGKHAIDDSKPSVHALARSTDGGESWSIEFPKVFSVEETTDPPAGIDLSAPDSAVLLKMESYKEGYSRWYYSPDRGKTWQGPYPLPRFDYPMVVARTDYLVEGPKSMTVFVTVSDAGGEGRAYTIAARTDDGGRTWRELGTLAKYDDGFSIMPSTVRLPGGRLVSAVRNKRGGNAYLEIVASDDGGKTWLHLADATGDLGGFGNPGSLLRLEDGRLCLTFGRRNKPKGIAAKLSTDGGTTWSREYTLRDDASNWDLGYPRSFQRIDSKVVVAYYFTTETHREQHVACTIWQPPVAPGRSD